MNDSFDIVLAEIRQRPHEALVLSQPLEIERLPTPALLLDEQALQRNIDKMATFLSERGKGFRPHSKTHKWSSDRAAPTPGRSSRDLCR